MQSAQLLHCVLGPLGLLHVENLLRLRDNFYEFFSSCSFRVKAFFLLPLPAGVYDLRRDIVDAFRYVLAVFSPSSLKASLVHRCLNELN